MRLMLYCEKCKKVRKHIPVDWGKCFCKTCRQWRDNPKSSNAERQGRSEATYPERSCSQEDRV
jgi:hypothetical protein